MSKSRLIQSIRCWSGPALFLTAVCMAIGMLFLVLGSGAGWIFVAAAGSVLVESGLLGTGGRNASYARRQRVPLASKRG